MRLAVGPPRLRECAIRGMSVRWPNLRGRNTTHRSHCPPVERYRKSTAISRPILGYLDDTTSRRSHGVFNFDGMASVSPDFVYDVVAYFRTALEASRLPLRSVGIQYYVRLPYSVNATTAVYRLFFYAAPVRYSLCGTAQLLTPHKDN